MSRIMLVICLVAASLSAKDRPWQESQLLDKSVNPYFHVTDTGSGSKNSPYIQTDSGAAVAVNSHSSDGNVMYDNFVIKTTDKVYLVELTRLASYKAPHVSVARPLSIAVDKDKLWIMDLDKTEYETKIVKKVDIDENGRVIAAPAVASAAPAPKTPQSQPQPAQRKAAAQQTPVQQTPVQQASAQQAPAQQAQAQPAQTQPNQTQQAQTKPAQQKTEAKVEKPKPVNLENAFTTASASKDDVPPPKPKAPPAPASKPDPKLEATAAKPPAKVEPAPPARPESPVARASSKDRAWQSGRLLSVPNNNYFFNVTYTSDLEGSSWAFTQGSDGRYTVSNQIAATTASPYTYDSYIIESQFCAYLVQRMRPKTSPPARFPGTDGLKFAVEKNKLWVLDEEGREYETKVVKLIQRDAIVDPLTRAAK